MKDLNDPGLEAEISVNPPEPRHGVVERAIERGGEVLLHIARITVVEDVVHRQSGSKLDAMAAKCEIHRILKLRVEADEGREAARLVFLAEVAPVLVEA